MIGLYFRGGQSGGGRELEMVGLADDFLTHLALLHSANRDSRIQTNEGLSSELSLKMRGGAERRAREDPDHWAAPGKGGQHQSGSFRKGNRLKQRLLAERGGFEPPIRV